MIRSFHFGARSKARTDPVYAVKRRKLVFLRVSRPGSDAHFLSPPPPRPKTNQLSQPVR